jgi:hypothetical protein
MKDSYGGDGIKNSLLLKDIWSTLCAWTMRAFSWHTLLWGSIFFLTCIPYVYGGTLSTHVASSSLERHLLHIFVLWCMTRVQNLFFHKLFFWERDEHDGWKCNGYMVDGLAHEGRWWIMMVCGGNDWAQECKVSHKDWILTQLNASINDIRDGVCA